MSKQALEILEKARNLIRLKSGWTQHEMARNANGEKVFSNDKTATCFCSIGAINAAAGNMIFARRCAKEVLSDFMNGNVVYFNDNHSHARVVRAFDKAIHHLKESVNENRQFN